MVCWDQNDDATSRLLDVLYTSMYGQHSAATEWFKTHSIQKQSLFFRWTCLKKWSKQKIKANCTLWFSMLEPKWFPIELGSLSSPIWTLNKQWPPLNQRHLWRSNKPRMLGPRGFAKPHGFMDVNSKIHNYCWWTKTNKLVNIPDIPPNCWQLLINTTKQYAIVDGIPLVWQLTYPLVN